MKIRKCTISVSKIKVLATAINFLMIAGMRTKVEHTLTILPKKCFFATVRLKSDVLCCGCGKLHESNLPIWSTNSTIGENLILHIFAYAHCYIRPNFNRLLTFFFNPTTKTIIIEGRRHLFWSRPRIKKICNTGNWFLYIWFHGTLGIIVTYY